MSNSNAAFLFWLCLLYSITGWSQHQQIPFDYLPPKVLQQNKVKHIEVTQNKASIGHYYLNANGTVHTAIYHDSYSKQLGQIKATHTFDSTTFQKNYTYGRLKTDGSYTEMEHEITTYSPTGKMLYNQHQSLSTHTEIRISRYDTTNYANVDLTLIKIRERDTFQLISTMQNTQGKTYIVKSKNKGIWEEDEKSITKINAPNEWEYWFYQKGKLMQHYTSEEIGQEKNYKTTDVVEAPLLYPLPASDTEKTDSIVVNDLTTKEPVASNKKARYKIITHYEFSSNKVFYYDVFDYKTGLLYQRVYPSNGEGTFEFLYEFY